MTEDSQFSLLVVDDTPDNLRLLKTLLGSQGYDVRLAPSGAMAIDFARENPPDLILLDVLMPEMSGFQVCETLKQDGRTRDIPVIFLSALSETEEKVRGFKLGAFDFITKPFQGEEVLARVRTQLSILCLQRELRQKNAQLERRASELVETRERLVQAAHVAGRAEIASTVLHDLGNALNSMFIGAERLCETCSDTHMIEFLGRVAWMLDEHKDDLGRFFQSDERARKLPEVLVKLHRGFDERNQNVRKELADLRDLVGRVDHILAAQQEHAQGVEAWQNDDVNAMIHGLLDFRRESMEQAGIDVVTQLENLPHIPVQRAKITTVLNHLIKNALTALERVEFKNHPKRLTIETALTADGDFVQIRIADNGCGLDSAEVEHLFRQGFSTTGGHGFGLHYCANVISEIGGKVDLMSDGPGKGAECRLHVPTAPRQRTT